MSVVVGSCREVMSFNDPSLAARPYKDPTPLPDNLPKVDELGATSAPLKSAAFFIGAYCKDYNGV
jgi:NADH dehydrogenase (ubiquinone) 1 alpha subcomplex subunit 8